ncbi:methyl-accepting chemotaxis protein [Paenibacillus elgii]|uniref:methyl-accepting chemotaxis protein n=1 Tax=Paenibacillus elgii TaxID=189691 RepID=UPI001300C32A|nr:methyl-accepting chemotaxis protein [Paenibacillus elgii]
MALKLLSPEDVESAISKPDPNSPPLQRLTEGLTAVSDTNKNVAQAYLFSEAFYDGKQRIVAMPKHLLEAGLKPGEYYENPAEVQQAIKAVNQSKQAAKSPVYHDDYGTWISIIQPVMNGQGQIIAVLGLDIHASAINENAARIWTMSLPVLLISLLVIMLIQYIFTKRTLAPVRDLFAAIDRVSRGHLDIELKTERRDDFGELNRQFSGMVGELRSMIAGVKQKAELAALSSRELADNVNRNIQGLKQIAGIIHEVANGAQTQDQSAAESARVMEEMAKGIQNIAETAYTVSEAASIMKEEALDGKESIQKLVSQMAGISHSVHRFASRLQQLEEHYEQIGGIVEDISGISTQTNLLALNAAIEAARAGEHGKGFAVVASEVRKLADLSARSAGKVTEIISRIQQETGKAVDLMREGIQEVEAGKRTSEETNKTFLRILEVIRKVSAQTEDMSAVTEQMSASSQEVTASVTGLSNIAKVSAGGAAEMAEGASGQLQQLAEMAESANRLNEMSKELNQLVSKFAF